MFANYLTVAFRNLKRYKSYTLINLIGLSLGFTAAILCSFLAWRLLAADTDFSKAEDIYTIHVGTDYWSSSTSWAPLASAMKETFPSVKRAVRVYQTKHEVYADDNDDQRYQQDVIYADSDFFEVFDFEMVAGNRESALSETYSVVLSKDAANKYFGTENPLGRYLWLDRRTRLTVTGVVEDLSNESSVDFDVLANYENAELNMRFVKVGRDNWRNNFVFTYLETQPGTDREAMQSSTAVFLKSQMGSAWYEGIKIELIPLLQEHETGHFYAYLLLMLSAGIMLLSIINYTNIAMSRSIDRAREIGVRKVLGARQSGLAGQFLVESMMLSLVALVAGLAFAELLLPSFNNLLEGLLDIDLNLRSSGVWFTAFVMALLIGLIAGAYPAFFLSRFNATEVIKGKLGNQPNGARLRSGLLIFQFAVSVFIFICAFFINRQIDYIQQRGFDFGEKPLITISTSPFGFEKPEEGLSHLERYVSALRRESDVEAVSISSSIPGDNWYWQTFPVSQSPNPAEDEVIQVHGSLVDSSHVATLGLELIRGRNFDKPNEAVINETALRVFGWEHGLGEIFYHKGEAYTVVGITKDFHFASMRWAIKPAVMIPFPPNSPNYLFTSIRVSGDTKNVLDAASELWPQVGSASGFTYNFADEYYSRVYRNETALSQIVTYAATVALIIALVGLFGLGSLSVIQRTREIGIRKVLGASTSNVVVLLSSRFFWLIAIAIIIASPIAMAVMNMWLEDYVYRTDLSLLSAVIPGLTILAAAMLVLALQTIRAALANPVESLRYE